jgi:hypothetical protein
MAGSSLRGTGREIAAGLDMTTTGIATGRTGITVGAKTMTRVATVAMITTVTGIVIASSARVAEHGQILQSA